jgi:hypothetical protein
MNIRTENLRTDREWRASTGYSEGQYKELLKHFELSYVNYKGSSMSEIRKGIPNNAKIRNCDDLLFFTLFALKSGLNYDLLGLVASMDNSNAKRNFELGVSILKDALKSGGFAPKREFKNLKEFNECFKDNEEIIIDGTENPIQRPQKAQKDYYSGKKSNIQ